MNSLAIGVGANHSLRLSWIFSILVATVGLEYLCSVVLAILIRVSVRAIRLSSSSERLAEELFSVVKRMGLVIIVLKSTW